MGSTAPPLKLDFSNWTPLHCALLLLLAAVSIYNFVRRDPTAFEWPAVDMACFFERQQDPTFLPHDYFTNSVSQPNPRHVFGYFVLGVARMLGTDWYGAYFALRCVHTVAIPMLWYLALWGMVRPRLTNQRAATIARLALGVAIVLVMRRDVSGWFSFAWWPPFFIYVAAHPLALAVGLLAIVLRTSRQMSAESMQFSRHSPSAVAESVKFLAYSRDSDGTRSVPATLGWAYWMSFPAWFCASLLHPSIGLFLATFYWLWAFDRGRWRELFSDLLCVVVLPYSVLLVLFRPPTSLPAAEFIEYYVHVAHPFHYQVSQFASLTGYPWWVSFGLVVSLLAIGGGLAEFRGDQRLARRSVAFLLAYAGCVAVQYVGTEVLLSKAIAVLGPSRFSCLGYSMVALVATNFLAEHWPAGYVDRAEQRLANSGQVRGALFRPAYLAAAGMVAVVAMYGLLRDDLQREIRGRYAGFYDWVDQSTVPDAVFLPPFDSPLHRELPIIARRAVYASQSFPFREDVMREHIDRLTVAYGELDRVNQGEGNDLLLRRRAFFRQLEPADIVKMADHYRLDYVVIEADQRGQYQGHQPCYADASLAVYAVDSLRASPYSEQPVPAIVSEPKASVLRK